MRFITGLVLGIVLTVGTAYVTDAVRAAPGPGDTSGSQQMVNWGVVNDNLKGVSTDVQYAWARIVGGAKDLDKKVDKAGA